MYEILGLSSEATENEIKEAYREIARVYHPDSNFFDEILEAAGLVAETQVPGGDMTKFKEITDAYNTLIDPEKRRLYDATLPKGLRDWGDTEPMVTRARTDWDTVPPTSNEPPRNNNSPTNILVPPEQPSGRQRKPTLTNFGSGVFRMNPDHDGQATVHPWPKQARRRKPTLWDRLRFRTKS